jgi:hypothetical protein
LGSAGGGGSVNKATNGAGGAAGACIIKNGQQVITAGSGTYAGSIA